jgi:hypothetical protein
MNTSVHRRMIVLSTKGFFSPGALAHLIQMYDEYGDSIVATWEASTIRGRDIYYLVNDEAKGDVSVAKRMLEEGTAIAALERNIHSSFYKR